MGASSGDGPASSLEEQRQDGPGEDFDDLGAVGGREGTVSALMPFSRYLYAPPESVAVRRRGWGSSSSCSIATDVPLRVAQSIT